MKFSVYSVGMPEFDIKESVAIAKKYGYDGIEWRVAPIPEKEPESYPFERRYWAWNKSTLDEKNIIEDAQKAKAYCDEAGLEIYGLATALGVYQTELVTDAIIAAGKIGCPIIRAGLVSYDPYKAEKPYNELVKDTKAKLLEYLPLLKENNVKIVLETHHGTMIASASAAYRVLEGLDPTYYGVIFDPGNMVGEGYEDYRKALTFSVPILPMYTSRTPLLNMQARMSSAPRSTGAFRSLSTRVRQISKSCSSLSTP